MTIAFVLGNGVSRQQVDLNSLKKFGPIYGCNALYRDFVPTVLVATDLPIATQIQESGYAKNNRFYTRKPLNDSGAQRVLQEYYGFSSGPNATALAAYDGALKIYMLGFDMGPTDRNLFNNVYAGSEFYKKADAQPTYTGNWVRQIIKVVSDYPTVNFVRVCGKTTAKIPELEQQKNIRHLDILQFLTRINKQEGL
jgi:hypothetical protein